MKLLTLTLVNAAGLPSFVFDPKGQSVQVSADNGIGKSTLVNLYCWLLWGKDAAGREPEGKSGFKLKPIGGKKLETSVTGVFHVEYEEIEFDTDRGNDGKSKKYVREVTLTRTFKEKWSTSRGGSTPEFKGHETTYKVNGVPCDNAAEFERAVLDLAGGDIERLKCLTLPDYFNEGLTWQERRAILIEIAGDVADSDVIAKTKALAKLPEVLGTLTVDQFKKVAVDKRKALVAQRSEIGPRIAELSRTDLPEGREMTETLILPLAPLRESLAALQAKRAALTSGGVIAEKTVRLRELEGEARSIYNRLRQEAYKEQDEAQKVLRAAEYVLGGEIRTANSLSSDIASEEVQLVRWDSDLKEFRAEWAKINAEGRDVSKYCPTCDQPLPESQIQEAREKFNLDKAKRLESNVAEGKNLRRKRDGLASSIDALKRDEDRLQLRIADLTIQRDEAKAKAVAMVDFDASCNAECVANAEEIEELAEEIHGLEQSGASTEGLDAEIVAVQSQINAAEQAQARAASAASARGRIAELEVQEQSLAAEIEALDFGLNLCDTFVKAKVKMLESRINSKFCTVSWVLFDTLVNGNLNPVCECRIAGTPGSTGEKIKAGVEIVSVLSDHFGLVVPCWIDGAESCTDIPPTRGQQIQLRVLKGQKSLKVEAI